MMRPCKIYFLSTCQMRSPVFPATVTVLHAAPVTSLFQSGRFIPFDAFPHFAPPSRPPASVTTRQFSVSPLSFLHDGAFPPER